MTMKLFKSEAGVFQPVQKRQFGFERLEKNLEDWLGANPHLLGDDILLIGRQVKTDRGAFIDLLALDRHGRVVVIEVKRGRAPRDTVAQLNDYLTAISGWSDGELARKANLIPYDREVNNLTLFYEPEDDTYYVGTNCKVKHTRVLSGLLKRNKPAIEAALGTDLRWDMDRWWSLSETVSDDPRKIAARIKAYIENLSPYLDQAIPGRAATNGGSSVTKTQLDFWTEFLRCAEDSGSKLRYPEPRPKGWMTINTGGFLYVAIATQNRMTVYLAVKGRDRKKNFDLLKTERAEIDKEFGSPLKWEVLPHRKESQIQVHHEGKLLDRSTWPETHKWMLKSLERFHTIFAPRIKRHQLKP
ncbi:MAG: DUF4268 domain-containing protein [Elusimicrobiota bacterium]|nr:DUF4268 domain-containing protein [Elusimicrobiota bacterium]